MATAYPNSDDDEEGSEEKALKLVVLGDSNCGKSALCQRFAQHGFPIKYTQTVGVDFHSRRIALPQNVSVLLQIWDVGGHTIGSPTMLNTYIYGAHALLFTYDVSSAQTFENLTDWISAAKKVTSQLEKPPRMALVGNKTDMEHRRVVRIEKHNKFAEQHLLEPFYVSAKTGDSVELMFKTIAAELLGVQLSKAEKEWNINVVTAQLPNEQAARREDILKRAQPAAATATATTTPTAPPENSNSSSGNQPKMKNSTVCTIQ